MPKKKLNLPADNDFEKIFNDLEQLEFWDFNDPNDQAFWEEFFQIENLLEASDELDPPSFTISVQNQRNGEVKTYRNIRLKAVKSAIES